MNKTIWIDTETTGTDPAKHGLIQMAMMVEIDNQIIDQHVFNIAPFEEDVIEDEALKVNGITREQLAEYPAPHTAYADMKALLTKHIDQYDRMDKFIVAGYNTQFDLNFLRAFWAKLGDKYFGSFFYHKPIDVDAIVVLINRLKGELPQYAKLVDALGRFGIEPPEGLHDAMTDIVYTRKLYGKVMYALKEAINNVGDNPGD